MFGVKGSLCLLNRQHQGLPGLFRRPGACRGQVRTRGSECPARGQSPTQAVLSVCIFTTVPELATLCGQWSCAVRSGDRGFRGVSCDQTALNFGSLFCADLVLLSVSCASF